VHLVQQRCCDDEALQVENLLTWKLFSKRGQIGPTDVIGAYQIVLFRDANKHQFHLDVGWQHERHALVVSFLELWQVQSTHHLPIFSDHYALFVVVQRYENPATSLLVSNPLVRYATENNDVTVRFTIITTIITKIFLKSESYHLEEVIRSLEEK